MSNPQRPTVFATVPEDVDRLLRALAGEHGVSRSAIVSAGIMHFADADWAYQHAMLVAERSVRRGELGVGDFLGRVNEIAAAQQEDDHP